MTPTRCDAVIVGAGPAGSTAAILLARAGWSVVLVEKQQFPRRKVCGDCIAASNFGLFDALGLGDRFAALAGPVLRRVALWHGPTSLVADLPPATDPHHPWGRALGREALDVMLLDQARASGARVMQPCVALSLSGPAGDPCLQVRDIESGEQQLVRAPVVILAQGTGLHRLADPGAARRVRRGSDLLAFKANFRGVRLADGLLPVLGFAGGYGGLVVADQGVTTLACCIRADRLDALRRASPGQSAGEVVEAMLKRDCAAVAQALQAARRDGAWLASGPLAPGWHGRRGAVHFCIGNATGEAHPIIGEGMSMAMQSAWLLCNHLLRVDRPTGRGAMPAAAGRWQADVQRRYQADWRRHFLPRLRLAAAFAHLAMRPALSGPLLALLRRWPGLLAWGAQRVTRWAGKLDCAADPDAVAHLAAAAASRRTGPAPPARAVTVP
jgi:2-polyprenyl-6-methoxyphenol hydroxylase-like FAD-dependent oxidoreductase